jgi:hypothetical protein
VCPKREKDSATEKRNDLTSDRKQQETGEEGRHDQLDR